MSDALRIELLPFRVHVILIEPGYIPSDMERAAGELSSKYVLGAQKSAYGPVYAGFQRGWGELTKGAKYTPADCARVILGAIRDDLAARALPSDARSQDRDFSEASADRPCFGSHDDEDISHTARRKLTIGAAVCRGGCFRPSRLSALFDFRLRP